MNVVDLAGKFAGFLAHHSGELRVVASTLESIVGSLPIDAQDKERLSGVLAQLQTNADRIAAAADALLNTPVETVTVDSADVEGAVRAVLPGVISTLIAQGAFDGVGTGHPVPLDPALPPAPVNG